MEKNKLADMPSFELWSFDEHGKRESKLLEITKDKDERGEVSKYHILFWGDSSLLKETGIKKEDGSLSLELRSSEMTLFAIRIGSYGLYKDLLFKDTERIQDEEMEPNAFTSKEQLEALRKFSETEHNFALAEQHANLRKFLPELRLQPDLIEDLISIPISKAEEQRQEHNFQYMEFSATRLPKSRIAITGDEKGFNVRLSRFFFEKAEAKDFCNSAKKLFAETPPNETRYNFMNSDNKSNPQHTSIIEFKGLQEEQMPILLETILSNGIIGQSVDNGGSRDMKMLATFQGLRKYLNNRDCDIPSDLFKLRRPVPNPKAVTTTAAESDEPHILQFILKNHRSNPDPSGPSGPRAG